MKTITKISALVVTGLILTGCGGGGGSSSSSLEGRFSDSAVEGLDYTTAPSGRSDKTSANGVYSFTAGDTVAFSLGDIVLGSATATTATLFPRDIANAIKAGQIASLLQSLDADGTATNGIDLSGLTEINATQTTTIQTVLDVTSLVEFTIANIQLLRPTATEVVSNADAAAHVVETLQCEYSGGYGGFYTPTTISGGVHTPTGDPAEVAGFIVDVSGNVQGFFAEGTDTSIVSPSIAIDFTANTLTFTSTDSHGIITGTVSDVNHLSGVVEDTDNDGGATFTASRVGSSIDVKYRFTGTYNGSDTGIFTFDIDNNNTITGKAYSVLEGQDFDLSGSVSGNTLTAQGVGGQGIMITATIDLSNGALSDSTWTNGDDSGNFTGTACILNTPAASTTTDEDDSVSGGFAPADKAAFAAKYSALTLTSGGDSFSSTISATMLTRNSDSATTPYVYTKTGANTATITGTTIGSFGFGDLTLTFASATAGTYVENDSTNSFSLTPR